MKSNKNNYSDLCKGDKCITINAPSNKNKDSDYPSNTKDNGGYSGGNSSNSGPSGYISNSGQYCGTYTEKYVADVSSVLVKMHGSKPSLVLGFNPSILTHQKDTDGVSKQTKGLINDLNYQLTVTGFQDPKGIILAHCDQTDVDMGVLVQTLQPFAFNLTVIDFSNNRLGDKAVENLFYTMGTHQTPAKYVQSINISNNFIGDYGANYIAESLKSGRYPATKNIDISGNNITEKGAGFIAKALQKIDHGISITIEKFNSSAKYLWQSSAKAMLFIAKNNGIETKDALTNQETIEHCKKGLPNVGKNIAVGIAKCNNIFVKYASPQDVTLQDVGTDIISIVFPQTVPALNAYCNTEKVFFSVVDEDFANCLEGLIGVDSNLNK